MANNQVFPGLIEASLSPVHHAGHGHHIHVGVQDLETVLNIFAGEIEGHEGAGGDSDLTGVEQPHLSDHVHHVLTWGDLHHRRLIKGWYVCDTGGHADPQTESSNDDREEKGRHEQASPKDGHTFEGILDHVRPPGRYVPETPANEALESSVVDLSHHFSGLGRGTEGAQPEKSGGRLSTFRG